MKKLSLKNLNLEADNMLQRNQLKTIMGGGYMGDDCLYECSNTISCPVATPTCQKFDCLKEDGTHTSQYVCMPN